MKISDIILILDFSDDQETTQDCTDTDEIDTGYANEPVEVVIPTSTLLAAGTDANKPKNPADIRTNAPSMYPGFQAGVK